MHQLELVILGGGKAQRLGKPKATLSFGGETLLERQVRQLSSLFRRTVYVTSSREKDLSVPSQVLRLVDKLPDKGPLGGIWTALSSDEVGDIFVVACDMPFVEKQLVEKVLEQKEGYQAVVPVSPRGLEPLLAFYSKDCAALAGKLVKSGKRRVISLLEQIKVRYITEEEVKEVDPEFKSFFNINTEEDYLEGLQRLKENV
jgi:molybdopterin-guanine dinucleotide biosynthesis protein A